ncbi:MAG: DNA primase [Betaproteobacteria bacterium]|nr:DNA primase [Betaproteobacteria bacterium]
MIPQSFIQDLLARIDIVEVIERHVQLKKQGANFVACCPFHSEKTPSFSVSPVKQFYHCFGCGAHGSAVGFLMEYSGLSYVDAIHELAHRLGLTVPEESRARRHSADVQPLTEVMARAARFYREQLKASPRAIDYLKGRGLTGEIAARFGLGYAPDGWQALAQAFPDYATAGQLHQCGLVIDGDTGRRWDRFRDRIMFPILDGRGNVIGFGGRIIDQGEPKYLNSPETPLFDKGRTLYGLPQARAAVRNLGRVIVVEGYMDVVALAQYGVTNAVATLGTATTPIHAQALLRAAPRVVFCFDGDNAGRKAAWRALESSLEHLGDDRVAAFLFLPEGHDPDSYVREAGAESFQRLAARAAPLAEFLLRELRAGRDLATAEGRASLVHDAKPLLARLHAPLLRLQLVRALAEISRISPAELEAACGLKPLVVPTRRPSGLAPGAPRRRPAPLSRTLLKIILQKPEWAARIPPEALLADGPEAEALRAIADAVDHGELPAGQLGMLLEHFRETAHHALLDEVVGELVAERADESALETVFGDALERVRGAELRQAIDALTRKERSDGLSAEERRRLAELLAKKHNSANS